MNPETRNTLMIKQEGKSFLITMCQKNCKAVLAEIVEHARAICAQRLGRARRPGHGERIAPSLAVKLKCTELSTSDRSYLLPGDPTGDIAWRRPPKELPVLSSQMQTEEQACEYLD